MITLDLSILNQKGTPMFYSDLTANIPAAGIAGRIFIATNSPYGLFRDTGSAWEQIAGVGGATANTIYTANDTLTSNRIVSSGGFDLSFTSTTYIGTATIGSGGSGKLIIGSSSADNGIQVFGANAPSIRLDNAQSGGTQRLVIGLSTATNNFIQGSTLGDICISTASSNALLFGMWQTINASEVMRISIASNLLIGTTTDSGQKLQVQGDAKIANVFTSNGTATTSNRILFYDGGGSASRIGIGYNGGIVFHSLSGNPYRFGFGVDGTNFSNPVFTIGSVVLESLLPYTFTKLGNGNNVILTYNGGGATTNTGIGVPSSNRGDLAFFTYNTLNMYFGTGVDSSTITASNSIMWLDGTTKSINVGTGTNISSSILTLSSTTKGFLTPRMTQAQILAIVSPVSGLSVFNTDINTPCFYDGTGWRKVSHASM